MLLEIGHNVTGLEDPVVTTSTIIEDLVVDPETAEPVEPRRYVADYIVGTSADDVRRHLYDNPGTVTHLPGNGAILGVEATLRTNGVKDAAWVAVDPQGRDADEAADFERFWGDFFGCPRGKPADVEDTHHTMHGTRSYEPGLRPEGV